MENETGKKRKVSATLRAMDPGDVEHFLPSQRSAVNSAVWRLNHEYRDGCRWAFRHWSGDKTVEVTRLS